MVVVGSPPLSTLPHEHALTLSSIESDVDRAEQERLHTLLAQRQRVGVLGNIPRLGHAGKDRPRLNFTDYLENEAQPPDQLWRGLFPGFDDPLGNNDWGCCGEAMALHGIEAMQHAAGMPVTPFTVKDCLSEYGVIGKFDQNAGPPGQNPTDNGTDNSVLVSVWKGDGIRCGDGSIHTITHAMNVEVGNVLAERIAITEFVALFRAIGLPINAQGQKTWWLRGDGKTGTAEKGSWGYHDIPYLGWSLAGDWDADSWGQLIPSGHRFDKAYGAQGIVVLSADMLNRSGVSPYGFNYTNLAADIQKLGGAM